LSVEPTNATRLIPATCVAAFTVERANPPDRSLVNGRAAPGVRIVLASIRTEGAPTRAARGTGLLYFRTDKELTERMTGAPGLECQKALDGGRRPARNALEGDRRSAMVAAIWLP
jgi:hypothetical protein